MNVIETDGLLKGAECRKWSNEGVRFGVSSEVTVEAHFVLTQLEACSSCSSQAKLKLRTKLFPHLETALSHSYRECLH